MSASPANALEPPRTGVICTFYSYKGGVGRSMALANAAALLAQWGKKVLIIDWDLEAPGIEKFFTQWLRGDRRSTPGLIELIRSTTGPIVMDWRACLIHAALPKSAPIAILHAGRDENSALYSENLRAINWDRLFETRRLGNVLEDLRNEWRAEYDFVLIDSRTGVTDIGGICTIFMPDILVCLFTATEQSLGGVRDVMRRARDAHARLPVDRRRLLVVPLPARDESNSEYELAAKWRGDFARELHEFFVDWIPKDESAERVLDHLKIPYFPYWSFGERLPVVEEDPDNPKTLAFSYQLVARLLLGKLNWEEVLKGTQSTEAGVAQKVLVEEKAAEAVRIRAEAVQAETERAAGERERERAEAAKRFQEFIETRLSPIVMENIRRGSRWLWTAWVAGFVSAGQLYLIFSHTLSGALDFVLPVAGFAASGGLSVFGFLRSDRHARLARQLGAEESRYRGGAGSYQSQSRGAVSRFVKRCEEIIAHAGRRSPLPPRATGRKLRRADRSAEDSPTTIRYKPKPLEPPLPPPIRSDARFAPPAQAPGAAPSPAPLAAPTEISAANLPVLESTAPAGALEIFVSYSSSELVEGWLKEFIPLLRLWLHEFVARDVLIYHDRSPRQHAMRLAELEAAAYVIAVVSRTYFATGYTLSEWETIREKHKRVTPVTLTGLRDIPSEFVDHRVVDFSDFAFVGEGFSKTERYVEFQDRVKRLAREIAGQIGGYEHASSPYG